MARPTKKKIRVIKRDDKIYKEIESFKDYELTNNTAFEMMNRNSEFKKDVSMLYDLYPEYDILNFIKNSTVPKDKLATRYKIAIAIMNKWNMNLNCLMNAYNPEALLLSNSLDYLIDGKSLNDIKGEISINMSNKIVAKLDIAYSRPKMTIKNISKVTKLEINLSLPKKDLLDYISKIKDEVDEKIKSPAETLGVKLEKADNLICDSKGKCFDSRKTLSKQEKVADMFYIYDCLELGMTQRKIQNEVYNYYANKGKEDRTLDAGTLRKYRSIAIDYIDNMKYKELITGVKQA